MDGPLISDRLRSLERITWQGDFNIPLPSRSIIEFSQLCRKPNVSMKVLAEQAEQEPGITLELLRHVNSSLVGLRQKVTCVARAIGIVGLANSASIVLTNALLKSMENVDSTLMSSQVFRRDSIERAAFARILAKYFPQCPITSYTAALLQDVMLPTLTSLYEADYREYLASSGFGGLEEFERQRFGWTHAELAAKMLLKWDFPIATVEAVLDHHSSPEMLLSRQEVGTPQLTCSVVSLLTDPLHQSPDGITRLVDLQKLHPGFRLLDVAAEVDKELRSMFPTLRNPTSLTARIQEGMLSQIEIRQTRQVASGRQFGNYVLQEKLAESSMGAIYLARHHMMRRMTAIKILRVDRMTARSIAQFEQEVQVTSRLRSPHTISIFDYGTTPDELFYYAMEYVDGCTLSAVVEQHGPLPDGRAIQLLRQACGSLAEAHASGLIHRDIKPDNLMISYLPGTGDHLTVLDFGLAKLNDANVDSLVQDQGSIVGTPLYMSPEAAMCNRKLDGRSDLYSLAAVAYFLLSGRPVFTGKRVLEILRQHMEDAPTRLHELVAGRVSEELCDLIMSCLAKDPDQRPASASVLAEKLAVCPQRSTWSAEQAGRWWDGRTNETADCRLIDEANATLIEV